MTNDFDEQTCETPAAAWDRQAQKRAIDELFQHSRQYRSSDSFRGLLAFVRKFRFYSPFNGMLIQIQRPGATFVAPASRWRSQYRRTIKPGANPIAILQPNGPVLFVFDVSDTELADPAVKIPVEVDQPFRVRGGVIRSELDRMMANAARDGIEIIVRQAGSQSAGLIRTSTSGRFVQFEVKSRPKPTFEPFPVRYQVFLNDSHSNESKFATLAHELAHLYCGHLGTPNPKHWPNRAGIDYRIAEFEAESVCCLVCSRLGLDNPSEEYLAGYFAHDPETPNISLDRVLAAAWLIEQMATEKLGKRKSEDDRT